MTNRNRKILLYCITLLICILIFFIAFYIFYKYGYKNSLPVEPEGSSLKNSMMAMYTPKEVCQ